MITVEWSGQPTGAPDGPLDPIRNAEAASIRRYVETQAYLMTGKVLDFGAGKPGTCREPQPYRSLIPGQYCPYDLGDTLEPPYDSILCTQVIHMVGPVWAIKLFRESIVAGGRLLMTYPSNWDEVEAGDLWRYTRNGMERLLMDYGFTIEHHERRAEVKLGNFRFPLGYGCVARAV